MMMRTLMTTAVLAIGWAGSASGQFLTTNEPTRGRITRVGESNEWTVLLKTEGKIRFAIACETGNLRGVLLRDGRTVMQLVSVNRNGSINSQNGHSIAMANPETGTFECESEKLFARGRYVIRIAGAGSTDIGPYVLTLVEPRFDTVQPVDRKGQAVLRSPGGAMPNEVAELKKEVAELKGEVAELKNRIRLLEKLAAEKK